MTNITVTESIFITRPPEAVWDFTQDFSKRAQWDKSILEAEVLQENPERMIRIKAAGNMNATLVYKQNDRPNKTSLKMDNIQSAFISGGGGSWRYEKTNNGTLWTQTNTLQLKQGFLIKLMAPMVRFSLQKGTRAAMKKAKEMIENLK